MDYTDDKRITRIEQTIEMLITRTNILAEKLNIDWQEIAQQQRKQQNQAEGEETTEVTGEIIQETTEDEGEGETN